MVYHIHNMNISKSYQIQLFITAIEFLIIHLKVNSYNDILSSGHSNMINSEIALIEGTATFS